MRTLGWSFSVCDDLVNMIHDRWFNAPIIFSSSLDIELRILWIIDYGDSWIIRMLKSLLFSKIVLVRSLFL